MANLTLAIDDDLLRAARIKAVQQGTSVNEICREAIERFALPAEDDQAFARELKALAARNAWRAKPGAAAQKLPPRAEVMDEAMDERFPILMAGATARGGRAGR